MLAVIAPSQPVAAALAAPNECCSVPSTSSVQQQHARDAVNTLQQAMSATASKMGMLQLQHTDQDVSSCVPAASPAVAPAPSPAGPAVQLETTSSSGSATGTTSRRRLSRSERKAVAPPVAGYSTDSYWNTRYAERSTHFDWFYNHSALAELINSTCDSQAGPCLHVGCGNSGFSEGMVQDGFQVVNVDISPVVIEQMRTMEQIPGQTWEVADCRSMPQYEDGSFGSVLDKGTLDAVLCSSHGTADAAAYVDEVYRLLCPGGVFLLISLGQPQSRLVSLRAAPAAASATPLPYLSADLQQRTAASAAAAAAAAAAAVPASTSADGGGSSSAVVQWQWGSVEVYLLPKPSLYMQSESSLTGKPIVAHTRHNDKDVPVEWLGPFKPGTELDAFVDEHSLDMREFFTAFACTKPSAAASAPAASSSST